MRFGPITVIAVADFLLIMAQAVFLFLYMHEDADDAEYIVMANDAVERDTLLATDPYTGFKWIDMSTKRMLSPFSTWIAVVARVTRMAPATLAHRYLPGLIVVLGYVAVFVAAGALLGGGDGASRKIGTAGSRRGDDDVMPDSRTAGIGGSAGGGRGGFASEGRLSAGVPWVALRFFQAMVIFGGATTRSYGSMLLLRAWQGKAVFCAVLLPLLLAELMEWGTDGSGDEGEMLLLWGGRILRLVVLSLASLLTTGMSIPMVPLLVGAFGLVYMGEEVLRRIKGNGN
ncbi:MAG: hypothetical protein IJV04_09875 [Lachnospiraceae bacterium]|nr:hypothetical protein [Lachnospiraceae bacterium]